MSCSIAPYGNLCQFTPVYFLKGNSFMEKKRVLIVDDSPLVLEMASEMLKEAGYDVRTATNGIEANNQIYYSLAGKPNLIIIDIMMPLLAGDKKARLLKQAEYTKDIPILFISTKEEQELKRLTIESGAAEGYICKPFTKHSLISEVRKYI